jgi:hypothetical protein
MEEILHHLGWFKHVPTQEIMRTIYQLAPGAMERSTNCRISQPSAEYISLVI